MGIVYCARHVHLDRTVALKLMAPEHAATVEARRRFIRESRIAASINHPNIVTVYDAGEIDGQLYIAMQLIDGSDLRTICQSEHILSPERVLWVLDQVASALDAAHEHGLIHRDVKPGNVLVDPQKAYLTDFGLTKNRRVMTDDSGSVTPEGHFIATVHDSTPEQTTGRDVDYRAHIHALAPMTYECLVGDVPYPRPDSMTTALAHMSDPIPKVTEKRPDLPAEIDGVIEKALSKDKEDRYGSCTEFYDAVDAALESAPSTVPRPPRRKRPASKPDARTTPERAGDGGGGRNRWPLVAAGVAGVAAIAIAVAVIASGGDKTATTTTNGTTRTSPIPPPAPNPYRVTTARIGRRPFGVAYGNGAVWATSFDQDTIRRVDPATGEVTGERISVGDGPIGVATT